MLVRVYTYMCAACTNSNLNSQYVPEIQSEKKKLKTCFVYLFTLGRVGIS